MRIVATSVFLREAKRLSKKYDTLVDDLKSFGESLLQNPEQGVALSGGFRKIRMSIRSKGKGKRAGARVITFNMFVDKKDEKIVLVTIYDKSERSSISEKEINDAYKSLFRN